MRVAAVFLLTLLGLACLPQQVRAHASLLSSDPVDGVALSTPPALVTLRFDEPVSLVSLRLMGPGAKEVPALAPPSFQGSTLTVSYPSKLPGGVYLLSYRVISADSHPLGGTVAFGVGRAGAEVLASGPAKASLAGNMWLAPSEIARWIFYAAIFATAGGALFHLSVTGLPARLRRTLQWCALIGIMAAVAQVGLRGALLAEAPLEGLLSAGTWRLGVQTTLFWSLLASAVGLAGCAIAFNGVKRVWRYVGTTAGVLALVGFPLSGHAASSEWRWLTTIALGLHMVAVAFWLGALWPLWTLLRGKTDARVAVRRFSRIAVPAVALLLASGSTLAVAQIRDTNTLLASQYGLLMLGKLALLAPLVALAAWNRLHLTPQLKAGMAGAAGRLGRVITWEMMLAGSILAVTAVLSFTPPRPPPPLPREAALPAVPEHVHKAGGARVVARTRGVRMVAEVVPARAGPNRIRVTLDQVGGAMPVPKEVWLELSLPTADVPPIRRELKLDDTGYWVHQGSELAIPGRWQLRLEVLVTDFDQLGISAEVNVR